MDAPTQSEPLIPADSRPSSPNARRKWIVAVSLIVAGIGGLAAWAVASPGAVSYYATPSEVLTDQADGTAIRGRNLRLGGRVADLERSGTLVTFGVTDGHKVVPVIYRGDVPDTLKDATDVIAEGQIGADGTLRATRVLAKCSSKFVDEKNPEHLGRT